MTRPANFFVWFQKILGLIFSKTLIVILLTCIFFVALGGVSHNKKWHISKINVIDSGVVSGDALREIVEKKILGNYFLVFARDNSYFLPQSEIKEEILNTYPRIATVDIEREDDTTIAIKITERKPYALWCGEPEKILGECWFLDKTGFVFDKAPHFSQGVYLETYIKLIEKDEGVPLRGQLPKDRFAMTDIFTKLLQKEVGESQSVKFFDNDENELVIRKSLIHPFLSGVKIKFKSEDNPELLIKNITTALFAEFPNNVSLNKKLLYVDLRFGNKIYFGFENQ